MLGIDLVLAVEGDVDIPPGLMPLERTHVDTCRGEYNLTLLANPDAWPTAVLLDPEARNAAFPHRPACSHQAALCRDYSAFAERRLPDPVEMTASAGRYMIRVPPSERERLLFVSAFFRPE